MTRLLSVLVISALTALPLFAKGAKKQSDMDKATAEIQAANTPAEGAKAIEFILTNSQRAPALALFMAAAGAQGSQRVEDAAFLFYAGQLRARLDLARFPPKGAGGDSPAVAIGALSSQIGQAINPAIMREPKSFKNVVEKVAAWMPTTPADYDPGWEFTSKTSEATAMEEFNARREDLVSHFRGLSTLLNDPEYFTAFKTLQDYNLGSLADMQNPTKIKAKEAAEKKLRSIETSRKIEGLFYRKPS